MVANDHKVSATFFAFMSAATLSSVFISDSCAEPSGCFMNAHAQKVSATFSALISSETLTIAFTSGSCAGPSGCFMMANAHQVSATFSAFILVEALGSSFINDPFVVSRSCFMVAQAHNATATSRSCISGETLRSACIMGACSCASSRGRFMVAGCTSLASHPAGVTCVQLQSSTMSAEASRYATPASNACCSVSRMQMTGAWQKDVWLHASEDRAWLDSHLAWVPCRGSSGMKCAHVRSTVGELRLQLILILASEHLTICNASIRPLWE
jgi:hypothetical protein